MVKWTLGLVTVVVLGVPASADDAAKKIVEKALTAHGGADSLKKYKASKSTMTGDMSVAGMDMTFEGKVFHEAPGKLKVSVDASIMGQKLTILQVANGDKLKNKVMFGDMDVSTGGDAEKEELKASVAIQDMTMIYPLLDEKKYTIKAEADADVDGKKVTVVKATSLDSSKTVTLSFDKESGLLVKTQRKAMGPGPDGTGKEVDEESFLTDYKKVNGIMVSMKTLVKHDGTKFMSFSLSDVEVLESLPAATFSTDD